MQDTQRATNSRLSLVLGHALLWGGFLVAAFCSVLRTEQAAKWQTIPWPGYLAAMVVGFIGVVLVRRAKRSHASDEAKTDAEYSTVRSSLETLTAVIDQLNTTADLRPAPGAVSLRHARLDGPLSQRGMAGDPKHLCPLRQRGPDGRRAMG